MAEHATGLTTWPTFLRNCLSGWCHTIPRFDFMFDCNYLVMFWTEFSIYQCQHSVLQESSAWVGLGRASELFKQ